MTENTIALLFPGQGSQAVGMGKDLSEKYPVAHQTFDEADDALGYKLSTVCFEGPEDQLRLTEITQPAILTVSIAVTARARDAHAQAQLRRGTQSGRILRARRVRDVQLCRRRPHRAQSRQVHAGSRSRGRGRDGRHPRHGRRRTSTAVCQDAAQGEVCEPANINSPEQIVISGNTAPSSAPPKLADERGAKRAKLLPVSAPFHCSLMKPAQDRLEKDLNALKLQKPVYPVACNVDAELVTDDLRARDTLVRQVTGSVKWEQCMRLLIGQGVQTFIEVGPGKVLLRTDAADRPLEDLPECQRRCHSDQNSGVAGQGPCLNLATTEHLLAPVRSHRKISSHGG